MGAATRTGFLTGLNTVLLISAFVAFAGAVLALWLVREHQIERGHATQRWTEQPARAARLVEEKL